MTININKKMGYASFSDDDLDEIIDVAKSFLPEVWRSYDYCRDFLHDKKNEGLLNIIHLADLYKSDHETKRSLIDEIIDNLMLYGLKLRYIK